jgi:glutathione S-transferase
MRIAKLRIHHFPATRSVRALWAAYETAQCPVEILPLNLYRGEHMRPEFLAINPNHNVPVMDVEWEDGSHQVILESAAMVVFLADAFPGAGLAPAELSSPARADWLQVIHLGSTQMDMALWQVRIHEHILPAEQRDPNTIDRYRGKIVNEFEPQIRSRLERGDYMCGDAFSAADIIMGYNVFWARGYGLCQDPIFRRYFSRLTKREALVKALADAKDFTLAPPGR